MNPVHLFVVCGQCLKLNTQPQITAHNDTTLASHSNDGTAIVFEDLCG